MPASRAPRALRRADVEPKPYLVVACVGLTFDASACDALVFAVRCRATRACVRDAAVSLLRVPVHKACYDAGLLGRGGVEKHMWLGIAVGRHCVCEAGGGARREAHGWWGIDMGGRGRGDKLTCASAYSVRPLNSWPSRGA